VNYAEFVEMTIGEVMQIRTEKFEGPLDLLLSMIEDEKLDITEISLAHVADQYIEHVENNKNIDPEEVANFLVIAAKLLLIKSKTLLPYLIKDEEEEELIDFTNQLRIYKDFLDATKKVEDILEQKNIMKGRGVMITNTQEKMFYPPPNISLGVLQATISEIIERLKPQEVLAEDTIIKSINIEEKIALIKNSLKKLNKINFSSLLEKGNTKIDVIINFMAVLELMKKKDILADQKILFGNIEIQRL